MESKEREELIRRYCKLSAVPMPAILTTFAVPLVWLVLVMTDEIRFNSTGIYYPGLSVCLGLTAAMLGLFLWSLITLVKGMDKPEWKEIEGDRTVRTAGTSWLSQNLSAGARRRAYRAAKQYGIQVPAENGVTVMVVLLPLLILCGSFVPEYLNSIAEQKQIIQIVVKASEVHADSVGAVVLLPQGRDDPSQSQESVMFVTVNCRVHQHRGGSE